MKLNNISFPYPVWGVADDYINPLEHTQVVVEEDSERNCYVVKLDVLSHNNIIEHYIKNGTAQYVCEVDCPSTFYKNVVSSDNPHFEVLIPKQSVGANIILSFTITAIKDIPDYYNPDFNSDYEDAEINIFVGDILALIDNIDFNVDIKYDSINDFSSFMTIEKDENKGYVHYSLDSETIKIYLPAEMFESYRNDILSNEQFNNIILGSLVYNALSYALSQLKQHLDEGDNYTWAQTLNYRLEHEDVFKGYDMDVGADRDMVVQLILGNPYKELFDSLKRLKPNQNVEEEE